VEHSKAFKDALKKANAESHVEPNTSGAIVANVLERKHGAGTVRYMTSQQGPTSPVSTVPAKSKDIRNALRELMEMTDNSVVSGPEGFRLSQIQWRVANRNHSARAFANEGYNAILLDKSDSVGVAMHEFGHHLEFRSDRIRKRALEFFKKRTVSDKPVQYAPGEHVLPDKFYDQYVGKLYVRFGVQQNTEVVSMGIQAIFEPRYWSRMANRDGEHMALIWSMLRGY
jgi:hypothetical protein